jgi:hypothetical protein
MPVYGYPVDEALRDMRTYGASQRRAARGRRRAMRARTPR